MKKSILFAVTAVGLVLAAPAYAAGNSNGQEKRVEDSRTKYQESNYAPSAYYDAPRTMTTREVYFDNSDREIIRDYMGRHYVVNCPAGQTISPNGCVPISNMRQTVETTTTTYTIGQPLAETIVYTDVPQPLMTKLRPVPAGYEYVVVDGDVVLLAPNRQVIDAVTWTPIQ